MTLVPFTVGRAEMLLPDADEGSNLYELYKAGIWYESDLLAAIHTQRRGGVFVDVGAGYGNHTVFFAVECGADRVVSIEPYPGCFSILEANIAHNDLAETVDARQALIHPEWDSATLNPPPGCEELPETWSWSTQPVLTEHGDTPCFTLDRILAGLDVAVMKIDVEEMSPQALRTGLETIRRCRPLVAVEAEPAEQPETDAIMLGQGYECLGRFCATPTFLWRAA